MGVLIPQNGYFLQERKTVFIIWPGYSYIIDDPNNNSLTISKMIFFIHSFGHWWIKMAM